MANYLKHADALFDQEKEGFNDPMAAIIEDLQDNVFFLKNGKKTIVKYIVEKMLRQPQQKGNDTHKSETMKTDQQKTREVKVIVNRLTFADSASPDHYDLQISIPAKKSDTQSDVQRTELNETSSMTLKNPTVAFQIKYDIVSNMFFMVQARSEFEQLEGDNAAADFKEVDKQLQAQIIKFIESKLQVIKEVVKENVKIDYAEGIKTKKLLKNDNNLVRLVDQA